MQVFVYGTLKSTEGAARLMYRAGGTKLRDYITDPKFTLYNLGGFPGVRPNGNTAITGELWEVNEDGVLDVLDNYEGYRVNDPESSLFLRNHEVDVDGTEYYIYIYNHQTRNYPSIETGEWKRN